MYRGCPQGSCLGLLLWTLVADRILKLYKHLYKKVVSYADDRAVIENADTCMGAKSPSKQTENFFEY